MNIATKAASLICAALLTALPAAAQVNKVLPYIQVAAATATIVNSSSQIAARLKGSK